MEDTNYVLITPARNEAAYIEKTLKAVTSQTVPPVRWVVVSDGSTDETEDIVSDYASRFPYIELLRRQGDPSRDYDSQVHAINAGYRLLKKVAYSYIGNLDADVSFARQYYAAILAKFRENPLLGIAGGSILEEEGGVFQPRRTNSTASVPHAVQLFRRRCYEDVGGYIPMKYGGPEWYAEVSARMKAWQVRSFPDLPVYHHKPPPIAEGRLKGGYRQGKIDYSVGSSPAFEMVKCLVGVPSKPYLLYAFCRFAGFLAGYVEREARPVSQEFVDFLRSEQRERIARLWRAPFSRDTDQL